MALLIWKTSILHGIFVFGPEGDHINSPLVVLVVLVVSADRYIATTTLAITAVFLEYLGQFLIDLHQIYRHSSVPKKHVSL